MAKFAVDVEGATYEVEAPNENTAWRWANTFHLQGKAASSDVPILDEFGAIVQPQQKQQPAPTLGEQAIGVGEAALALGTGATGGAVGMIGGTLKGLAEQILSGQFGTQQAADLVEQEAVRGAEALTYAPRTQAGQELTQAAGEALAPLVAIAPMTAELGLLAEGARAATPSAVAAGQRAAAPVGQVAQRATQAVRQAVTGEEAPVAAPSAGAQGVELATLRREKAEALPVPVKLTKGAETREAGQLAFEKEQIKGELGAPLRQRAEENNLQAMQNFDALIDMTGAEMPDLASTGNRVITALSEGYKRAKTETNVAYSKARKSPEAQAQVDPGAKVVIGEGDNQIQGSLIDYLNSKPVGVPSSAVSDSVRQYVKRLGIASEDAEGNLVPMRATVGAMEDLRKEVSGTASRTEPVQIRDETIIKKIIDAQTEPASGQLFKEARALRAQQARKFENRAIVARLITNRRGMDDPQVAADQVFRRSIVNASPEEITFLRRVMQTSGDDGRQAWKDTQGAMLNYIRDESSKGMGMDSADRPIISPARLNQVVQSFDQNGRLDVVLGKKNAQTVRDLNDVVKYVNTVPPGTLINNSGTAGALMAAMAEAGTTGALTGLPVPVISALRALSKAARSAKVKAKINRALNVRAKEL